MKDFIDTRNSYRFLKYFQYLEHEYRTLDNQYSFRDNVISIKLASNTCDEPRTIDCVLGEYNKVVINGEMGSGKSVLVQYFIQAMSYYTVNLTKIACGNLISLKFDVDGYYNNKNAGISVETFKDYIIQTFNKIVPEDKDLVNEHSIFENDDVIFDTLLHNKQLVLIFEDITKLSKIGRNLFLKLLKEFSLEYPNIKYLIVGNYAPDNFYQFHIKPFDYQQIKDYITLYTQNRKCDKQSSERLISLILNNPKLIVMCGNPKRLKTICDLSLNTFPLHYIMLDDTELNDLKEIYRNIL